eukprot:SAG22_NODE_3002_length_2035_cov_1.421488_2_plen_308_part_00
MDSIQKIKNIKKNKYVKNSLTFIERYQQSILLSSIALVIIPLMIGQITSKISTNKKLKDKAAPQTLSKTSHTLQKQQKKIKEITATKAEIAKLESAYFKEDDMLHFASFWIPEVARAQQLIINDMSYSQPKKVKGQWQHKIILKISASYETWLNFLHEIESFDKAIEIKSLKIEKKDTESKTVDSEITLISYGTPVAKDNIKFKNNNNNNTTKNKHFRNIFKALSQVQGQHHHSATHSKKSYQIALRGIIWDEEKPMAVLSIQNKQKILGIDEIFQHNHIVDINKESILIRQNNQFKTLHIGEQFIQ